MNIPQQLLVSLLLFNVTIAPSQIVSPTSPHEPTSPLLKKIARCFQTFAHEADNAAKALTRVLQLESNTESDTESDTEEQTPYQVPHHIKNLSEAQLPQQIHQELAQKNYLEQRKLPRSPRTKTPSPRDTMQQSLPFEQAITSSQPSSRNQGTSIDQTTKQPATTDNISLRRLSSADGFDMCQDARPSPTEDFSNINLTLND